MALNDTAMSFTSVLMLVPGCVQTHGSHTYVLSLSLTTCCTPPKFLIYAGEYVAIKKSRNPTSNMSIGHLLYPKKGKCV